jgi:hypothetical protein
MTVMLFVQMSCVNTYAIGSNHTSVFWTAIANEALDLDKADFLADGYPVQVEGNRSTPGARPAPSSSKRKASDAWGSPSKRKRDDTDDEDSSSDDEGDDLNDEDFTPAPLETPRKSDAPGSSASSGQPLASPSTTPKSKKKKRGSVTELINLMAASLQGLATTTTANAELNLKMHAEARMDQQDFQKFMMDQHKAQMEAILLQQRQQQMQQDVMQQTLQTLMTGFMPGSLAALTPPPSTPQTLLLGNQQSGSDISGGSAPPAASPVAPPPPPPPAPASAPPAPRQVSSTATDDANDSLGFSGAAGSANADTAASLDTDAAAGGSQ